MEPQAETCELARPHRCVADLLRFWAERTPTAIALEAPDHPPVTYAHLYDRVCRLSSAFEEAGIQPRDRVGIVLPNGPEAAIAFLSAAVGATSAPLNPSYTESEFEFYLSDLDAKAVVTQRNFETSARAVAGRRGIPVLDLGPTPGNEAGSFELSGAREGPGAGTPLGGPDDVALVLHTSGTTARPKVVPLTHRNLCSSAHHIRVALGLTDADACLNVMPLFHIHGLIGGLLSSLSAGGRVVCAPGFQGDRFLSWVRKHEPTWYTAVPTMHQAVLAHAAARPEEAAHARFRLIRSSSSPLPPKLFRQMETQWRAPVIDSYGMTEAAHQMTSNPLPPATRKPGSVGLAAGPEVAIVDEQGRLLERGAVGEIAIRGPNVTPGYANNPEANAEAFVNGWFRTGDQGYFDADGYLYLTGRLKEMINRGGENVAPREVDEVLMEHEAVAQAAAFGVPHPSLGEDLAAAVVLRPGAGTSELDLRKFAAARLAGFKVPSRIVFLDAIPKGPTGKVQRLGLREQLADALRVEYAAPETEEEEWVAAAFAEVLGRDAVGRDDNFFFHGGDSLQATRVLARIRPRLNRDVPVTLLFQYPTPALLGQELRRVRESRNELDSLVDELLTLSPEEVDRLLTEETRRDDPTD